MTGAIQSNRLRSFMLLIILASLPGCATLNKEECLVADWRLIGYQDGAAGRPATVLDDYREDCARHAVVPDLDRYQAGRAEGLQEYCQPDNGYRLGEAGRGYSGICPAELEEGFRTAYHKGREIHRAHSAVQKTHAMIHRRQQALQDLKDDKGVKFSELIADGLQSEQRVLILYEITEIEREMNRVEDEIATLEYDLAHQQAHLDSLRQRAAR